VRRRQAALDLAQGLERVIYFLENDSPGRRLRMHSTKPSASRFATNSKHAGVVELLTAEVCVPAVTE